ncbi:hypothetical protein MLD38_010951 [Melastoma candidum]|uniref:Uncharacterized protein n=1 Tax=Melastoma candidum TaxID=119954 RepID=A0ACB9R225_9MYRT|nr:hypothetical protein MLD38_010951 [Melastoma candidum]
MGVIDLGTGKFQLRFEDGAQIEYILRRADWHIIGCPVPLQKWLIGHLLDKLELKSLLLWVRLKNVPLELQHTEGIEYIASDLGKPICMGSKLEAGGCTV